VHGILKVTVRGRLPITETIFNFFAFSVVAFFLLSFAETIHFSLLSHFLLIVMSRRPAKGPAIMSRLQFL